MPKLASDHPFRAAGFIHESELLEVFGVSPNVWKNDYRTRIPGKTTKTGRWFHRDDLIAWWRSTASGESATP
jgi:hypothetical protein